MLGRFLDRAALPLDLFPISQNLGNNEHPMVYHGLSWFIMVYGQVFGSESSRERLVALEGTSQNDDGFSQRSNLHVELGSFNGIS